MFTEIKNLVINDIIFEKFKFVKYQDYEDAAYMRDLEKALISDTQNLDDIRNVINLYINRAWTKKSKNVLSDFDRKINNHVRKIKLERLNAN